jgi:TadE-like protein
MAARGPRHQERGVELVEMAFVLPLMLILLLGIIYFGRAYDVYQTITRAAREGARQAVLTGCATCANPTTIPSSSFIQSTYVDPALTAASLDPNDKMSYAETYVWMNSPDDSICGVEIKFEYPYHIELPFTGFKKTIPIPTSVRMRLENQPTTCQIGSTP